MQMRENVSSAVLAILRAFSGHDEISLEDHIGAQLNITGGDAVELYNTLERDFKIDLRPLTESSSGPMRRHLFGLFRYSEGSDPTVREIIDFLTRG